MEETVRWALFQAITIPQRILVSKNYKNRGRNLKQRDSFARAKVGSSIHSNQSNERLKLAGKLISQNTEQDENNRKSAHNSPKKLQPPSSKVESSKSLGLGEYSGLAAKDRVSCRLHTFYCCTKSSKTENLSNAFWVSWVLDYKLLSLSAAYHSL